MKKNFCHVAHYYDSSENCDIYLVFDAASLDDHYLRRLAGRYLRDSSYYKADCIKCVGLHAFLSPFDLESFVSDLLVINPGCIILNFGCVEL